MKNLIITGGAGGIGASLVKSLIDKGFFLLIIGRSHKKYENLLSLLGQKENIEFFQLDISNSHSVKEFYESFNERGADIFGLINMAAIQQPISEFAECELKEWSKNLSINLLGTVNMIYGFVNIIGDNKKKHKIINFSGGGATSPRSNFSAYAASKSGIVNLTEVLSYEFRDKNIDINSVSPGLIDTNMLDEILMMGEKAGPDYQKLLSKNNNNEYDDVKNIITLCNYLLSSDSDGISGKIISAIWDDFKNKKFIDRLKNDSNFCVLRRVDSINFDKIN